MEAAVSNDPLLVNIIHGYDNKAFVLHDEPVAKKSDFIIVSAESVSVNSFDGYRFSSNNYKDERMKLGIDLRHGSILSDYPNDPPRTPTIETQVRFIRLARESTEKTYGFEVKTVRDQHFICTVINDSVAQSSGLLVGDLLREVNSDSIENTTHEQVCRIVQSNPLKVDFTVVNKPELLLHFLEEDKKIYGNTEGIYLNC